MRTTRLRRQVGMGGGNSGWGLWEEKREGADGKERDRWLVRVGDGADHITEHKSTIPSLLTASLSSHRARSLTHHQAPSDTLHVLLNPAITRQLPAPFIIFSSLSCTTSFQLYTYLLHTTASTVKPSGNWFSKATYDTIQSHLTFVYHVIPSPTRRRQQYEYIVRNTKHYCPNYIRRNKGNRYCTTKLSHVDCESQG